MTRIYDDRQLEHDGHLEHAAHLQKQALLTHLAGIYRKLASALPKARICPTLTHPAAKERKKKDLSLDSRHDFVVYARIDTGHRRHDSWLEVRHVLGH